MAGSQPTAVRAPPRESPAMMKRVARRRQRPATYDDLKQVPDHMVGEILDGDLVVSPHPGLAHARAALNISIDLAGPFDRSGGGAGWWFLAEPELTSPR